MVHTILREADLFCPNSVRINFTIYHNKMFDSLAGTLIKAPKVIKLDPLMLILSIHDEKNDTINHCLVVKHALNLMYEAKVGYHIVVYGHYNHRHQLIVDRFLISSDH